ncbi:hypothetical protein HDU76_006424 [Blyttiomyces sp. JEL0837]|nr:hypothetical protein HDU76_006424 [Blyttiomyces sp. JEL0837]
MTVRGLSSTAPSSIDMKTSTGHAALAALLPMMLQQQQQMLMKADNSVNTANKQQQQQDQMELIESLRNELKELKAVNENQRVEIEELKENVKDMSLKIYARDMVIKKRNQTVEELQMKVDDMSHVELEKTHEKTDEVENDDSKEEEDKEVAAVETLPGPENKDGDQITETGVNGSNGSDDARESSNASTPISNDNTATTTTNDKSASDNTNITSTAVNIPEQENLLEKVRGIPKVVLKFGEMTGCHEGKHQEFEFAVWETHGGGVASKKCCVDCGRIVWYKNGRAYQVLNE